MRLGSWGGETFLTSGCCVAVDAVFWETGPRAAFFVFWALLFGAGTPSRRVAHEKKKEEAQISTLLPVVPSSSSPVTQRSQLERAHLVPVEHGQPCNGSFSETTNRFAIDVKRQMWQMRQRQQQEQSFGFTLRVFEI
jgi:hypothetical protein